MGAVRRIKADDEARWRELKMRVKTEERTHFPWAVKEPLLRETGGRCAHCGVELDRYTNLSVDHVIPLNKGGSNDPENLTVLCDDCNLEKSDMVIPPSVWYPYLSKTKKKTLMERMRTYMNETDYLDESCLMPSDIFRVEVPVNPVRKCSAGLRIMRMPVYIQGLRMNRDDAFAWLMKYKQSLSYQDAAVMVKHPAELRTPCYLLTKGSLEVAVCDPWIVHEWDEEEQNYRNEIIVDWFFSPDLPKRDYLPETLSYMVAGVESYIAGAMSIGMKGACPVLFRIRCFTSDRFCTPVFDMLKGTRNDGMYLVGKKHQEAKIRDMGNIRIIGKPSVCRELKKALDEQYPDKEMSLKDAMRLNGELNKRLEGGKEKTQ